MNEVTRIVLGRSQFTISIEAHQALKKYLAEVRQTVKDDEVVHEVELRMAELLHEHDVTGDTVVLTADVDYLQQQLGKPGDFSGEDETTDTMEPDERASKRLFRDTDNAIVAGVAAGLAGYTGLDAVLIRIIFILLTIFAGGTGLLLYVIFWIAIPPATNASEKLQMRGRAVTLDTLKDSVSKADVPGAARRVHSIVTPVINGIFRIGIKVIGVGFILAGLAMFIGMAVLKMYMLLHNGQLFQENLFPVGGREDWLLGLGILLVAIVAIFFVLLGISSFKHKWPIRGWATGVLAGVFLLIAAAGLTLGADAAPHIRDRYESGLHTTAVKDIQPFTRVQIDGSIDIAYVSSPNYAVNLHYFGKPDTSKIKVSVQNGVLHVDSRELDATRHCTMLCLFPGYDMTVQVYAPNLDMSNLVTSGDSEVFYPAPPELN